VNKIRNLRTELDDMHKDLKEKKDAFQKKAGSSVFHSTAKVHEKFMLDEDSAMYHLSLETNPNPNPNPNWRTAPCIISLWRRRLR